MRRVSPLKPDRSKQTATTPDQDTGGAMPPGARRGRGAQSNRNGRFERYSHETIDDGWGTLDREFGEAPGRVETDVEWTPARHVISRNQSPDVPFEQSINPYRGCEHGCIYCYARPSHAYLGLSPGHDFESKLFAKQNAAEVLKAELGRKTYRPSVIALGANTDPYQPVERRLEVTRSILEVLAAHRHPVGIVTKSALVQRDIDVLSAMARDGLVRVHVSITTLDRRLARAMEPRASTPPRRLEAVRALADAGIPVGVMVAPILPALTDHEIETILAAAADAGAESADYILLRLPQEVGPLFEEWLMATCPDRAARVLSLIRQSRGGRIYDSRFGHRMRGEGAFAKLIADRFRIASHRHGLDKRGPPLRTDLFCRPGQPGSQLSLL